MNTTVQPGRPRPVLALRRALGTLPLSITGLGLLLNSSSAERERVTPDAPAHHTPTGFRNLYGAPRQHKGLWPYLKMRYFEQRFPAPSPGDGPSPQAIDTQAIAAPRAPLQVTWIGHASTLVQIAGKNILTDPVFGARASPLPGVGPRRYSAPGLSLAQLPPIDYVVVSHNHFDHLERATVRHFGDKVQWLVPLGLKAWFAKQGVHRVTELDWWQSASLAGVTFTLTPTQHWSRRGLSDTNATLWGAWAIEYAGKRVWFGGDTGYAEPLFKHIGERLGPFDLALIPIGGYSPRDFMREKHADPDDAVRIHRDLRARASVAIHWGTFVLTSEPIAEPPQRLAQALQTHGIAPHEFRALAPGQTLALAAATTTEPIPIAPVAAARR